MRGEALIPVGAPPGAGETAFIEALLARDDAVSTWPRGMCGFGLTGDTLKLWRA